MNEALVGWLMALETADDAVTLEDFVRRPEWHQQAACRGVGPSTTSVAPGGNYEDVRARCAGCPVRRDCLEAVLADDSLVGLWGGTTDVERRAMRRGAVA